MNSDTKQKYYAWIKGNQLQTVPLPPFDPQRYLPNPEPEYEPGRATY